jgi:Tfp pilus assembly protein PilV
MTTKTAVNKTPRHLQAGFSLIEAMVALLIVAFGLLAIGAFHFSLTRASDVAKQRTEATRIAEKEIERLRSFLSREADGTPGDENYTYQENVASAGATTVTGVVTNTTFTLTRDVATPAGDRFRWISVLVTWMDRTNQQQEVRLTSAISDGDPSDLGVLGTTRGFGSTLRPKNRNINIPYPAVTLAGGVTSAFVPPPGNVAYVFSNTTGNILQSCVPTVYDLASIVGVGSSVTAITSLTNPFASGDQVAVSGLTDTRFNGTFTLAAVSGGNTFSYVPGSAFPASPGVTETSVGTVTRIADLREGMTLDATTGYTCTDFSVQAYLLSGYIRFYDGSNPTADDIINTNGTTRALNAGAPFTITNAPSGQPLPATTPSCYAQRQRVMQAPNVDSETINTLVRSGNTVTVTTQRNHGYTVGLVVDITGASDYLFNGQFEVLSVPAPNQITYFQPGTSGSATGGLLQLVQQLTLAEGAPIPSGYSGQPISTFVSYACVVTPTSVSGGIPEWWGRLDLVTDGSWTIGAATGQYRVCRYSADYNGNGILSNSEHPSIYRQVTGTLDNQNFVVIRGTASCPTDVAPDYTGTHAGDLVNTNTFSQQPSITLSVGEPAANATTALPME